MLTVRIELNKDRIKPGSLVVLEDGAVLLGPYQCLGKADNKAAVKAGNPSRNPEFRMGDTPTGEWLITKVIRTNTPGLSEHSYGPGGALDLKPTSGSCVVAYKNGRSGIWIHGGDPSPAGKLRPTNGCIRVANDDMSRLIQRLQPALATARIPLLILESEG